MSKVNKIIEHYFRQQQSEEVQRRFFFWLKHADTSREKEEVLSRLWEETSVPPDLSTEISYRQVEKRLGFTWRTGNRALYIRTARIAALFLIPLLSVITAWYYVQHQQAPEINLVECYVPNGQIQEIILPDNSHVLVNSGSTLFYQEKFNGRIRDIYLSGEATFTISPDKKKPFIVKTGDMSVEALGTEFNVSSYPDNPHTVTTLIEGKVGVHIKSTETDFILRPGEQVVFDKETGFSSQKEARLDYVLAWQKGQLIFQSASLHQIVEELERRFNVTIYINAANLSNEKITVKFLYEETLEDILHTLQQIITGFKYKIDNEKIYIN